MSYTITLLPSGHTFQAKSSQTIIEAAMDAGVHFEMEHAVHAKVKSLRAKYI